MLICDYDLKIENMIFHDLWWFLCYKICRISDTVMYLKSWCNVIFFSSSPCKTVSATDNFIVDSCCHLTFIKYRENSDVTLCFCSLCGNRCINNLLAFTIRTILKTQHRKLCVFIICFLNFPFLMEFYYESYDLSGECNQS